ncbi:MAG: hypothetical protein JO282_08475 [Alphaproteobacteria bacterium]|nr:hypothetical protein [Alphaproteobacteria bacterium]
MSSLPTWAIWSIAAAAVLSPVLAFLTAIAIEILIGSLMDAGVPVLLPLAVTGALGYEALATIRRRSRASICRRGLAQEEKPPRPGATSGGAATG